MDATNIAVHKIGAVAPRPKLPFFEIGASLDISRAWGAPATAYRMLAVM